MCHLILFLPAFAMPVFWLFPFSTALPIYLMTVGLSFLIYINIFKAMRQQVQTGQEGMLGKKGLVIQDINPEGKIQYAGEIWDAKTKGDRFSRGDQVKICGVQGLVCLVEEISMNMGQMKIRK